MDIETIREEFKKRGYDYDNEPDEIVMKLFKHHGQVIQLEYAIKEFKKAIFIEFPILEKFINRMKECIGRIG